VEISLNQRYYAPGDRFLLTNQVTNPGAAREVDLYIILDVWGEYWFWPSWTQSVDHASRSLPPEAAMGETILDFEWPAGAGAADGLIFWSGILDAGTTDLLDYDSVVFGYH
jgi:hypothetical protein